MSNGVEVVPFLLVAADVDVGVVGAPVGESVHQPGVPVEGEDHRLVRGEQGVEVPVGQPMWVFGVVLQPHQVDDVDESHLQVRQPVPQDR